MEHQKVLNLLDNTPNQPPKFMTNNWVEINGESPGTYNSQIRFQTSMLKLRLCDYSDADLLLSGTTTITGEGADDATKRLDERNEVAIFKNCTPFIDCTS